MVITNAKIFTCDNDRIIENGYVEYHNGKITALGSGKYNGDDETFDAEGQMLFPGFIDAHCHIGMFEEGICFEGDDGNEMTDPCTPQIRAIDAINPMDIAFNDAISYGITTVVTGPGSSNPIAGQIVAMKTYGKIIDKMIIKTPVAIKFALGENPKKTYDSKDETPSTRMAITSIIREQLIKAQKYAKDIEKAKNEENDMPDYDAKCEALLPLLNREIKAHFHIHRADDICTAIRISKEFNLDTVLIHCTEGHILADELAEEKYPIVVGPIISTRSKPELKNVSRENYAKLKRAGNIVAINTDFPEVPIEMLAMSVAICGKYCDYSLNELIKSITCDAAKIVGIYDRVGSITVGKDADLILFKNSPLELLEKPTKVIINGKFVDN